MRREAAFFGDQELELVQMSRRLRDALGVEELLEREGIDYHVEADAYSARFLFLFPTQRVGAFFWVLPADAIRAREAIAAAGFTAVAPEPDRGATARAEEVIP